MSKFEKVAGKKIMVKLQKLNGETAVWATCTQAVKDFAAKAFKEGDTVNVQYEDTPNGELKYHVSRIEKGDGTDTKTGGGTPNPSATGTPNTDKPKCSDCGKELKDAKYEKCYVCNKKNPSKSKGKGSYGKSPEEQDSIKRQAIGKMTAQSLIAMQGQVDPNNIVGLIETLYKKYRELVG